jgi:hypothetical protein
MHLPLQPIAQQDCDSLRAKPVQLRDLRVCADFVKVWECCGPHGVSTFFAT